MDNRSLDKIFNPQNGSLTVTKTGHWVTVYCAVCAFYSAHRSPTPKPFPNDSSKSRPFVPQKTWAAKVKQHKHKQPNMKFLLITLISTIASVNGQLLTMDASAVSPVEVAPVEAVVPLPAPEMVVFYVNEHATATACTEAELMYLDNKMVPDMDMTLSANNFEAPEWEFTATGGTRRTLTATCDWCRTNYPRYYCNGIYNCGFRRNLRKSQDATRKLDTAELSSNLLLDCQYNVKALSMSKYLSATCRAAIGTAICHVEFI